MKTSIHNMAKTLAALAVATCAALDAGATTYYVKPDGNDSADGLSWATALKTADAGRNKINVAPKNHELVFAKGTYAIPSGGFGLYGGGGGNRSIIRGATEDPADVVLDGQGLSEVMRLSANVTVANLTIANGTNSGRSNYASGIRIGDAEPANQNYLAIVSNCIIRSCANVYTNGYKINGKDAYGAAAYVYGNGLLVDCVVSNNSAIHRGSAVALDNSVTGGSSSTGAGAKALRCTICDNVGTNTADSGVAVLGVSGGSLIDCTVSRNIGSFAAGALNVLYVEGCTFDGNVLKKNMGGHSGSAMVVNSVAATVTNCTFSGNIAEDGFSTVLINIGGTRLIDCRFIENAVGSYGGAISFNIWNNTVPVAMRDCLFSGNASSKSSNKGGGAIRVDVGDIALSNCTFTGNSAALGAAVDIVGDNSSVSFEDCLFDGNTAKTSGGAARVATGARATFNGCRFFANETESNPTDGNENKHAGGGAIFLHEQSGNSWCTITNCVFGGNATACRGGAFGATWNGVCMADITDCIFTNNSSFRQGGAISIREETARSDKGATIRNCLIANNRTTKTTDDSNGAGLLLVTRAPVRVENCTIVSNVTVHTTSGGVHHRWGGTLVNCIVAFNKKDGGANDEVASGTTWSDTAGTYLNCCSWPNMPSHLTTANGCINADPKFTDAAHGDFTLDAGSPCLNKGTVLAWMDGATDLSGLVSRISGSAPDIGCYERDIAGAFVIIMR